jgi:hypothetical protein
MKVKVYVGLFLAVLFGTNNVFSQSFLDYRDSFKLVDWKFYKGDIHSAESGGDISGQGWEDVKVPHTWNAKDVLTEGDHCYRGVGWYRSSFDLPQEQKSKRYFIRFEGVCLVADVFVNGVYIGRHKGGYSAFCYEISQQVRPGQKNSISVKVDNSMQADVAPSGTYLYPLFGGIYRPVTVFSTNDICISPLDYASSGIYIRPVNVSEKEADIEVMTLLDYNTTPLMRTKSAELLPPKGQKGKGFYGEYFDNPDLKGKPKHTQIDEEVVFNYGNKGPFEDMPADNFSARWTGRFVPEKTGVYRFFLKSDDGSRLFLDNKPFIDHWGTHAASEKSNQILLDAGKEVAVRIEYNEVGGEASMFFGWTFIEEQKSAEVTLKTTVLDNNNVIAQSREKVVVKNNQLAQSISKIHIDNPHLWDAKKDPHLYKVNVCVEDQQGVKIDEMDQPMGLRFFEVDRDKGLILNGKPYHLHGVCRHQEWEGLGPALTDEHHKKDIELILELGANGVRLAHYQQADKMYSLCDEKGLVVWAEIPNTPAYRAENPAYVQNCKDQLTELIKQNYNHPSILFWGMYNEIPISAEDVKGLHQTAKSLDPYRLTTQADYAQPTARHFETDVAAWNWYFGWYYDNFNKYGSWYDNLHKQYPQLKGGLSEYGAGGCITQQQENPSRPDPYNGKFFPEQYQRLYHEQVWRSIKDRDDIWCKFIWNMFDFSWTFVNRGDRPYINHKGLVTHDRKVKKDSFYFYKANWSEEPVLYILSRRNTQRTEEAVEVAVYTNLDEVELYVNGKLISRKKMESDIHKIIWKDVVLRPGRNQINVIGQKGDEKYTDACEWAYVKNKD